MLSKTRQLIRKWMTWKAIDDGVGGTNVGRSRFGEDAARELDELLRRAGAHERQAGEGRLRQRVLGSIVSRPRASSGPIALPLRPLLVGAVAVIALGVGLGAIWASGQRSLMQDVGTNTQLTHEPQRGLPQLLDRGIEEIRAQARGIPSDVDAPITQEASALMRDVRTAWRFFRARLISPIPLPLHSIGDEVQPATAVPNEA